MLTPNLRNNSMDKYNYYLHFIGEETDTQRWRDLTEVSQLVNGRARRLTLACCLQRHTLTRDALWPLCNEHYRSSVGIKKKWREDKKMLTMVFFGSWDYRYFKLSVLLYRSNFPCWLCNLYIIEEKNLSN